MKRISCLLILITLILAGCKKEYDGKPPEVTIMEPSDSSVFRKKSVISIKVTAEEPEGTSVQLFLYIDGAMIDEGSGDSLEYDWDTYNTNIGEHKIKASAIDASELEGSAEISVTIIESKVYDLFPLEVGNEFFYNYSCAYHPALPPTNWIDTVIKRDVKWTIVSMDTAKDGHSIQYKFEELFYNGTIEYFNPPLIEDFTEVDTNNFIISEYPNRGTFSYKGYWFPKYSINSETYDTNESTFLYEFHIGPGGGYVDVVARKYWYLVADSGFTRISYYRQPTDIDHPHLGSHQDILYELISATILK